MSTYTELVIVQVIEFTQLSHCFVFLNNELVEIYSTWLLVLWACIPVHCTDKYSFVRILLHK